MSLRFALLTSLLEKPGTGAELARRFDKSIGYFWHATHQQIYRELGTLERHGLIEAREVATSRGAGREFAVLEEGRADLQRWAATAADPKPLRDEFYVRIRAAAALDEPNIYAEIQRQRGLHTDLLAQYRAIEERDFAQLGELSRPEALQRAVLRAGIHFETAWLLWCEETLAAR